MLRSVVLSVIVWFLEFIVVAAMISEHWSYEIIDKEKAMVERELGTAMAAEIERRTDDAFYRIFLRTGIRDTIHHFFIPTEQERIRSGAMRDLGRHDVFPIFEERLNVIWSSIYQMMYRTMLFLLWAPYLLLLFLPALLDGLAVRQIKKTNFDYASPMVHRYAIYTILVTLYLLLLAMFAPLPIPPALLPFAGAVIAMMLGLVAANTQKRI